MSTSTPSAPPLREAAPATAAAPVAEAVRSGLVTDPNAIAAVISAAADPAALLTYVVLAVAARSATAAEQGVLLHQVQTACADMAKRVRETLLDAVDHSPGDYDGFEVTARAGSRSVDYALLEDRYPAIYREVVRVGRPTLVVRYPVD